MPLAWVAAGLLGPQIIHSSHPAFWILGLVLHFFIAFSAAAVYCIASGKLDFLKKQSVMRAIRIKLDYDKLTFVALFALLISTGCDRIQKERNMLDQRQTEQAIAGLRAAYAAFNRGDIDAAVELLDPQVEWAEPSEFPGGGTYHGLDAVKRYLTQSREGAAEVISKPERFIPAGNRIVVFVHARVLPKGASTWQDVKLADVYTFQGVRVIQMHAFADRQDALRWVGIAP